MPTSSLSSIAMGVAAVSLVAGVAVLDTVRSGGNTVAIFPPWWSRHESLLAAASVADLVGVGRFAPVVFVASDDPALRSRLRASGALLVMSLPLFTGCRAAQARSAKDHSS